MSRCSRRAKAVAGTEQTGEEREQAVPRLRWSNAGHPPRAVDHRYCVVNRTLGRAQRMPVSEA